MADRYFSPEEVEALIPRLAEIMEEVAAAHRAAEEVRSRIQDERRRIALSGGGVIDQAAFAADRARLTSLAAGIQRSLERIVQMGGAPKDLEMGLVDFPHLRDGVEVNLCWRRGETEIRYWHGLDEGFAGRKAL